VCAVTERQATAHSTKGVSGTQVFILSAQVHVQWNKVTQLRRTDPVKSHSLEVLNARSSWNVLERKQMLQAHRAAPRQRERHPPAHITNRMSTRWMTTMITLRSPLSRVERMSTKLSTTTAPKAGKSSIT